MRSLTAAEVIEIWESGEGRTPLECSLLLFQAAFPGQVPEELGARSVGQRDAAILKLRELTIGRKLSCYVRCPRCAGELQFDFDVSQIQTAPIGATPPARLEWQIGGYRLSARPLRLQDLVPIYDSPDLEIARWRLVERCFLEARRNDQPVGYHELPDEVIGEAGERLAAADPQSETRFALKCPDCEHEWLALFDVASYVWRELATRAQRLLYEVHRLAEAYAWSQTEILAMTAARRRLYLKMLA